VPVESFWGSSKSSHNATGSDSAVLLGPVAGQGSGRLNGPHGLHARHHLAENYVPAVQVGSLRGANEELRAVSVGASVGHGQDAGALVLEGEVLVGELGAVDGLAASTIAFGEVAALDHKVLDDAMELAALVAEAGGPFAKLPKVVGGLGHIVAVEANRDTAGRLATDLDVKVHLGADFVRVVGHGCCC